MDENQTSRIIYWLFCFENCQLPFANLTEGLFAHLGETALIGRKIGGTVEGLASAALGMLSIEQRIG